MKTKKQLLGSATMLGLFALATACGSKPNLAVPEAPSGQPVGLSPTETAASLGDIVRNENGSVRHMSQNDAEEYCRGQGSRLPTARELAVYSQSLGARGIRETAHPGVVRSAATVQAEIAQMRGHGYDAIYTANSSGLPAVDFYFNYSGYQRPAGDLGIIGSGLRRFILATPISPTVWMAPVVTSPTSPAAASTTTMRCAACGRASVVS